MFFTLTRFGILEMLSDLQLSIYSPFTTDISRIFFKKAIQNRELKLITEGNREKKKNHKEIN